MLAQTKVFRTAAVARYGTRREQTTLPRLNPPRVRFAARLLIVAFLVAAVGIAVVRIPVYATAAASSHRASNVILTPARGDAYAVGQRVFIRRRTDHIVVGRGTIVRVAGNSAEARVGADFRAVRPAMTEAIVETGSETLFRALMRRVATLSLQHNT
ncbi:MAG TPA: hypothetical protein VFN10_15795 [Thermoanaerobaculia bacterium]|nr:hypothetical protein [Thermoanaerobaculia bacterium]